MASKVTTNRKNNLAFLLFSLCLNIEQPELISIEDQRFQQNNPNFSITNNSITTSITEQQNDPNVRTIIALQQINSSTKGRTNSRAMLLTTIITNINYQDTHQNQLSYLDM
ncbi:hypothetical protein ACTFIU_000438 [Dictyostelium citrinum]